MSAAQFNTLFSYDPEKINEKLEYLEDAFNLIVVKSDTTMNTEIFKELGQLLLEYSQILNITHLFSPLTDAMDYLAKTMLNLEQFSFASDIMPRLITIFDNLDAWQRGVFLYQNIDNIYTMQEIIINDILELQAFIDEQNLSFSEK